MSLITLSAILQHKEEQFKHKRYTKGHTGDYIEGHTGGHMSLKEGEKFVRDFIIFIIVVAIIDILIIILAVHYILECSKAQNWNMWITVILIILLFAPGVGTALGMAIIIYGLAGGCAPNPKLSFSFF
jgi:hypothetical protein